MSPVVGLTVSFGTRPWFAPGHGPEMAPFTAPTAETEVPPVNDRVLPSRTPLTWFGVSAGFFSSISAATAATTGAAIEVPLALMYAPPMTQVGHRSVNALPGASTDAMREPGA